MVREPLELQESAGIKLFHFRGWNELHQALHGSRLSVGFTSRIGGLNVALHVNDDENAVIQNRRLLGRTLGIEPERWVCAEQVHGKRIEHVGRHACGAGFLHLSDAVPGTDGLMTDEPGVWLTSFYADCVPLYFYDPVHGAIAVAHAGWRGTVADMAGQVVDSMERRYGSKATELRALIGPSIGACCYEVDEFVADKVAELLSFDSATEHVLQSSIGSVGKYMLDLKRCNQLLMMKAGLLSDHIEMSQWCTSCRTDLFFSHRAEQGKTGRMAAWIYMDDQM